MARNYYESCSDLALAPFSMFVFCDWMLKIVSFNTALYVLQRNEERVIIISSKDSDNVISDAENALHQIAGLILQVI